MNTLNGSETHGGRLRVLFLLEVPTGNQTDFLAAYEQIRHTVADLDGHIVDQVCQSTEDPTHWLITSEWESPDHFQAWERGPGHAELAGPLVGTTTARQSLRFVVRRETRHDEEN